ncbi:MAG: hypothetical protein WDM90_21190 [Ferruginibacter sp.]
MNKTGVLVTGVGGSGIGGQILKALRMSSLPLHIIGTDTTELSTGFKEVDEFNKVPLANEQEYIPALVQICRQWNIKIIFPGSEPELKVISKNRHIFIDEGIVVPVIQKMLLMFASINLRLINF